MPSGPTSCSPPPPGTTRASCSACANSGTRVCSMDVTSFARLAAACRLAGRMLGLPAQGDRLAAGVDGSMRASRRRCGAAAPSQRPLRGVVGTADRGGSRDLPRRPAAPRWRTWPPPGGPIPARGPRAAAGPPPGGRGRARRARPAGGLRAHRDSAGRRGRRRRCPGDLAPRRSRQPAGPTVARRAGGAGRGAGAHERGTGAGRRRRGRREARRRCHARPRVAARERGGAARSVDPLRPPPKRSRRSPVAARRRRTPIVVGLRLPAPRPRAGRRGVARARWRRPSGAPVQPSRRSVPPRHLRRRGGAAATAAYVLLPAAALGVVPAAAMAGAAAATGLVWWMARGPLGPSPTRMILAGVAVNAATSAAILTMLAAGPVAAPARRHRGHDGLARLGLRGAGRVARSVRARARIRAAPARARPGSARHRRGVGGRPRRRGRDRPPEGVPGRRGAVRGRGRVRRGDRFRGAGHAAPLPAGVGREHASPAAARGDRRCGAHGAGRPGRPPGARPGGAPRGRRDRAAGRAVLRRAPEARTGRDDARTAPDAARASALSGGYGGDEVVRGVDLDVAEGECVAVLGPNGAGKSTLLRLLAGILPASSGYVELRGKTLQRGGGARWRARWVSFPRSSTLRSRSR